MVRIIDMECSVPHGLVGEAEPAPARPEPAATAGGGAPGQPAGYGMANYSRIFRSRREGADHRPEMDIDVECPSCSHRFKAGEEAFLWWPEQNRGAPIRIVFRQLGGLADLAEVGFEFKGREDFWPVTFPPDPFS